MSDFGGSFSRPLSLFVSGKTDNEKLAALLIIAKLLKEQETDQTTRRKIFEKIGFNFINRLLITDSQDSDSLSQVAVAILSSFCSDPELALHPQVTSKLPHFNRFISSRVCPLGVVNDSLYCIKVLALVVKGRQYLWKYNTLYSLIQCFIAHQSHREISKSIISYLLTDADQVKASTDLILESVQFLATEIKQTQSELKFELCELLTDVNQWSGEYLISLSNSKWLVDIGTALSDVLQSRLDVSRHNIGLMLLCVLCQVYGCHWLLEVPHREGKSKSSLLLLTVHLVNVEISMLAETTPITVLEGTDSSTSLPVSHSLLVLSFSFIEKVILLVAESSEEELEGRRGGERMYPSLSEEDLLQLHSALLECLTNIVKLLQRISAGSPGGGARGNLFLIPAIRVIGAWLAEDSLSLVSEVSVLIPFIMQYCLEEKEGGGTEGGVEVVRFLVPGLSCFIHEESYYQLLMDSGLLTVLMKYTESLSTRLDDVTVQSQLLMCMSLMFEVVEKEEEKRRELSDPVWMEWMSILSSLIRNTVVQDHCSLSIHTATLHLMILRITTSSSYTIQGSSIDAIRACIDVILKSSCHSLSTSTSCTTDTNCSERNKISNTRDNDDTGNASDDETYTSCRSGPVTMASSQQSTPDHFDTIPLGMKQLSALVMVNPEIEEAVKSSSSLPVLRQMFINLSATREAHARTAQSLAAMTQDQEEVMLLAIGKLLLELGM